MAIWRRKPNDLDRFMAAMDGEWKVVDHVIDDGRVRVVHQSMVHPDITWSHTPFAGKDCLAPIGIVGRICFSWHKPAETMRGS